MDLSSTTDITALVLVSKDEEDAIQIQPHFWIPGDNIGERMRRDRVHCEAWIDQGLINFTNGNVIHYGAIQRKLEELREVHDIREIAFDRWGATKLSVDLTEAGFNMIQFGQNYASLSAPTKELSIWCYRRNSGIAATRDAVDGRLHGCKAGLGGPNF